MQTRNVPAVAKSLRLYGPPTFGLLFQPRTQFKVAHIGGHPLACPRQWRSKASCASRTRACRRFFMRRFDEAVQKFRLAIQEDSSFPVPYRFLATCYAHMGRLADAREIVTRLRTITPVVMDEASYLRNTEHRDLLLSGLRLAAGEA
jgi:hypothetical protein